MFIKLTKKLALKCPMSFEKKIVLSAEWRGKCEMGKNVRISCDMKLEKSIMEKVSQEILQTWSRTVYTLLCKSLLWHSFTPVKKAFI